MTEPISILTIALTATGTVAGIGGTVFVQYLRGRSELAQKLLGVDHEQKQAELARTLQLLDAVKDRWQTVEDIHAECPTRYQIQLENAISVERVHCDRELKRAEAEWKFEMEKLKQKFRELESKVGDMSEAEAF